MQHDERRPKVARVTENSFGALIKLFMSPANPKWARYAEATRYLWGRELRRIAQPDLLGAKSLDVIRPALIQALLDGFDGRPGKQAAMYGALKQLEKWATVRDLIQRPIMLGVETERPQDGHTPWTDRHVELAEEHARTDLARAITLAANTGQRGSDLVRMGPTDLEVFNGLAGLNVTQKKTGRQLWVPITGPLAAAMERWERRPGPYLLRPDGAPWKGKDLTQAWHYERTHNPALAPLAAAGLVLHGLRATACVRLRRKGATAIQIADLVGMSTQMVERYCRFSVQRENAAAAVLVLGRTFGEQSVEKTEKNRS